MTGYQGSGVTNYENKTRRRVSLRVQKEDANKLKQKESMQDGMEMKSHDQAEKGALADVVTNSGSSNIRVQRFGQIFLAEYVATTFLMFCVCLGCMDGISKNPLSPLQSPITSGFAVAALVAVFGHISDCHMNPAVTACFLSLGKIDIVASFVYLCAEMLGAVSGVGLLRFLVPTSILESNPGQCETNPHAEMSHGAAAAFEFFITSLLILLICAMTDSRNATKQDSGAIKFGLTITALSFVGGSLTGASLNPARTFAPALWNNSWSGHWAYWVGPMTAGFVIPKMYKFLFEKDLTNKL